MNRVLGTVLALTLSTSSVYAGVSGGNANSNWTIYGWQNWSYEMIDDDNRDFTRINNNAANIGFAASIDTGRHCPPAAYCCTPDNARLTGTVAHPHCPPRRIASEGRQEEEQHEGRESK